MIRPAAQFTAEELQVDEDAEREAKAVEWGSMVRVAECAGALFALLFLTAIILALGGPR